MIDAAAAFVSIKYLHHYSPVDCVGFYSFCHKLHHKNHARPHPRYVTFDYPGIYPILPVNGYHFRWCNTSRGCGGGKRRERLEERGAIPLRWSAADIAETSQVSCEKRKLHTPHHITEEGLQICGFLPNDILKDCLVKLPLCEHLFRMKPVSKPMKQCIESEHFQFLRGEVRPNECSLTAVHFTGNESGVWEGSGFDLTLKQWRRLPRLVIPSQAVDSSSQSSHLIAGGGGLLCFLSLSNFLGERSVIVCNPCTLKTRALPPLRLSWKPKLLHLISDSRTMSYQVIVAGYARTGGVSSIHAVIYDSTTSTWTTASSDISGTDLRFKQYQTGALVEHRLYCIAVDGHETKHVLQCNLENCTWLVRSVPFPDHQQNATLRSTDEAQLVECNGDLYLFSRQGFTHKVQSLYRLVQPSTADPHWEHLWRRPEELGRHPEYTCVPFGEDKLCIFNTKYVTGFVYDIHAHSFSELPSRCSQVSGITYGIKNHLGFMLQPNFKQKP